MIYACSYYVNQWRKFEKEMKSKDFSTIKRNYDTSVDNKNIKNPIYLEMMEFRLSRYNFLIPLFPVFKASAIRKDFDFALYLEFSMIKKLDNFFKFSWTCWLCTIMIVFLWSWIATNTSILAMVNFY
jgi:hypothetical protein